MYNVKSFEKSAKRCARIFLHLQFPDTIIEMNLILNEIIKWSTISLSWIIIKLKRITNL